MSYKKTVNPAFAARNKPLDYTPKPNLVTSNSWLLSRAQNVYKQLTLTWGRKLVVGAFPFIAYFSVTFFDYRRTRYNFQLQQADFFKQSIACIANSTAVRDAYGRDIKLKRASFWTVTSGFVPWINERHVWLGFSGERKNGWIRMGLRRTDFVLDKDVLKTISDDIDKGLRRDIQKSLEAAKGEELSEATGSSTSTEDLNSTSPEDLNSSSTEDSNLPSSEDSVSRAVTGDDAVTTDTNEPAQESTADRAPPKRDYNLTTKERIDQQVTEQEEKTKLNREQSEKYMEEMRRLYPTLPEEFGQNDIEQAVAVKKDRLLDGQIFNNTWDLLSLSVHPEKAGEGEVFVLWDPEESYVDQGDYWINTNMVAIKKPQFLRSSVVATSTQGQSAAVPASPEAT